MAVARSDDWAGYLRTIVELRRPDGENLVVRPVAAGRVGRWPWSSPEPVYILTAWDPGDERPGEAINRRHQAALEEELEALTEERWPAVGRDPLSGHREEGVAVRGVTEAEALALGACYRQDAIFTWTPREWAVVACNRARRVVRGWSLG